MKIKEFFVSYFTRAEKILWISSVLSILIFHLLFGEGGALSLCASLIGVTALIFCAKGNPVGQLLMICFSLCYGVISFRSRYYGEMITYLGMSAPMALLSLITWLRNPYAKGESKQVKVNQGMSRKEIGFMAILTVAVTVAFYFILDVFGTANLLISTLSMTTSFGAVYLTYRRSPYFALVYGLNDLVLILLWAMAAKDDPSCLAVLVCFVAFFANDTYSFINWQRMKRIQREML